MAAPATSTVSAFPPRSGVQIPMLQVSCVAWSLRFFCAYTRIQPSYFIFGFSVPKSHHEIALIGAAGQIGTPLSLLCKISDLFSEASLYDLVLVPGIATDLMHIDTRANVDGYLAEDSGLNKALTGAMLWS
ncbi:hypothetical protein BO82DRAFT_404482 [Aspergillus uvarum CBS 121591]|uniref:malate dehydrogenase n=1 Tax=Aspergillus uvarum CBS 121591 TaxID=1448315 RepID=A0A319DIA7_9EURO|nr:hypothetical protein BO82DRAFT_404482 [Aspergillus uvarum CBS 121591]PYH79242.1 hypothetical protein BO82DRAFT_404482 [Aspergillus uvarum CBS 121591]